MLFDCGEGTQRQMMKYGISFALEEIFFTHVHADHFLGVIGLMRTMALQGRTEPIRLYGPLRSEKLIMQAIMIGSDKQHFPVSYTELKPDEPLVRDGYSIVPYKVEHAGATALGYALIETPRLGRFNPELAKEFGIPEGPLWGKIHKGESITLEDGRVITPDMLVGPTRSGRKVVLTGDCRPSPATVEISKGADLLIHEATFTQEEGDRAIETGHSTASDAALVAKKAGVRQLALTHISSRYSRDAHELSREARTIFKSTIVAKDGMEIEVPFVD